MYSPGHYQIDKICGCIAVASLGVSPGSKLCTTFLNIAKYFKTLRCGCGAVAFIFFNLLKTSTVPCIMCSTEHRTKSSRGLSQSGGQCLCLPFFQGYKLLTYCGTAFKCHANIALWGSKVINVTCNYKQYFISRVTLSMLKFHVIS